MSLILRVYNETRSIQTDLDLFGDEPINLQLSFSEIQDIKKRNSAFTKGFDLPGSKKNNTFFNHYYNVDSIGISYDVNKKYPCDILYNGAEVLVGNIRLNSVNVRDTQKTYKVTFYNQVGDLAANIADKLVCDLDMTDLEHEWSVENISKSWDIEYLTTPNPSGWPKRGLFDGKIIYPMLHLGYTYEQIEGGTDVINTDITPLFDLNGGIDTISDSETPLLMDYLKLALQVKDVYERIVKEAGYTIESKFFNSVFFRNFYYPQTEKKGSYGLDQLSTTSYFWEVEMTTEVEPTSTLPVPVTFDNIVTDTTPLWVNNEKFYFPVGGTYEHMIYYNIFSIFNCQGGTDDRDEGTWGIYLLRYNSSGTLISDTRVATNNIYCNEQQQATITTSVNISGNIGTTPTSDYFRWGIEGYTDTALGGVAFNKLFIKQINWPNVVVGIDVDVTKEISCNIKQIEFIQSINQWFNLVVIPKPDEENVLIIEPYEQWVGSGETLDWTQKVDVSSNIKVEPTNKIADTSVTFDLKDSKDFYNVEWKKGNPNNFTTRVKNFDTDFKSNDNKIKGIFGIAQDSIIPQVAGRKNTLPIFYQTKEEEKDNGIVVTKLLAYKTVPKLIYYNGYDRLSPTGGLPSWFMKDTNGNSYEFNNWPQFNLYTNFDSGWLLDDGSGNLYSNTKFISWDKDDQSDVVKPQLKEYGGLFIPTEEVNDYVSDQYENFYEEYLENLHNSESRLVTCKIYLNPNEIKDLDFSERIRIENSLYVINKIGNYDLTKPSLATVELLKVVDDYRIKPNEFYFKFEACNPLEKDYTLYTSTAYTQAPELLNPFNIDDVFRIGGICYTYVELSPIPTPDVIYQPLDFEFESGIGITPEILSFADCTACEAPFTSDFYRIRECGGTLTQDVKSTSNLVIGKIYNLGRQNNCDGPIMAWGCWEVIEYLTSYDNFCVTPLGFDNPYDTCFECDGTNQPETFYYTIEGCDEFNSTYVVSSQIPLLLNRVYDLELNNGIVTGCFTIINETVAADGYAVTDVFNNGDNFVNCETCENPTTTTTTTDSPTCTRIRVDGTTLSGELVEISFIDCDGEPRTETMAWSNSVQTYFFCIQQGTLQIIELAPDASVTDLNQLCS